MCPPDPTTILFAHAFTRMTTSESWEGKGEKVQKYIPPTGLAIA